MKINWFPGHMKKALDMMKIELKKVDLVIYVLDARIPKSSLNPSFKSICSNKPIIFVLNKTDMADEIQTKKWINYLKDETNEVINLDCRKSGTTVAIKTKMKQMLQPKIEHNERKGIKIPLRAMVIGVPNCGKSTLINNFCGKAKAITGNKAGVTKGKQWVKVDDMIELMDTPGTLYPNIDDSNVANKLAFVGSVKDEVLDFGDLGYAFLELITKIYPELVSKRYDINLEDKEIIEIMEEICYKRGISPKNKEVDYEKTGRAIIDDFRKGRLGNISLEKL